MPCRLGTLCLWRTGDPMSGPATPRRDEPGAAWRDGSGALGSTDRTPYGQTGSRPMAGRTSGPMAGPGSRLKTRRGSRPIGERVRGPTAGTGSRPMSGQDRWPAPAGMTRKQRPGRLHPRSSVPAAQANFQPWFSVAGGDADVADGVDGAFLQARTRSDFALVPESESRVCSHR